MVVVSLIGTFIMFFILMVEGYNRNKTEDGIRRQAIVEYAQSGVGAVCWVGGCNRFAPTGEEVIRTVDGVKSSKTGKVIFNERDAYIENSKKWLRELADSLSVKYIDYGDGKGIVDRNNNQIELIKSGKNYCVRIKGTETIIETITELSKCIYLNGCFARKYKNLNIKNTKYNSCDFFKIKY